MKVEDPMYHSWDPVEPNVEIIFLKWTLHGADFLREEEIEPKEQF